MKAVQIERFGAPEVLEVAEVSAPEPQGDEVLIEVEAVGVNRADLLTRSGLYHRAGQPPLVPGFEGSGVVREIGDSVERFAPGDRVFAFGGRPGFYAELVAVSERRVVDVPEGLDFASAAARPAASAMLRCRSRSSRTRRCSRSLDQRRRWPGPCETAPITG